MANQMRAWQIARPGILEHQLQLKSIPQPLATTLNSGQILVRVMAASLNPADFKTPEMGWITWAVLTYPYTVGMDLSGVVVARLDVKDVVVGERVVVRQSPFNTSGALAEYAVASRHEYAPLYKDTNFDEAAGLPTAGLTAYQTIQPYVKTGDKIFINGGAGGVGTYAIQIGKLLGCHVTTTCSTGKVDLCRSLGADEIIDYKSTDVLEALAEKGEVFAHVIDNIGTSPSFLHASISRFLSPQAKFVPVYGAATWATFKQLTYAVLCPSWLGGGTAAVTNYLTTNKREDCYSLLSG